MEQNMLPRANCGKCVKEVYNRLTQHFPFNHDYPVQTLKVTRASEVKTVELRTAEETEKGDVLKLVKLNPCFLKDGQEVTCRAPECSATTTHRNPTDSSEKSERGLWLCENHLTMLTNLILERCGKQNVILDIASYSLEDINGYTSLIRWLEQAFRCTMKKSPSNPTDFVLAEVLLNSRNFLIITYALLTPDDDSLITVLVPYMTLLRRFLSSLNNLEMLNILLVTLQEVMNTILLFFGIIYGWVVMPNTGAQVGSYVGLALGLLGAIVYGSVPAGIVASSAVGLIAGKLIGGGTYVWYREHRYEQLQEQMVQSYQKYMSEQLKKPVAHVPPLYYMPVNADGDLVLHT